MKKSSCGTILVLLLAVLCLCCQPDDQVSPYANASQTRTMVLGKWSIEKIYYQVCRNGSCNTTNYTGSPKDYFEFRADSAFLAHQTSGSYKSYDAFKADYSLPGAFTLKKEFWSARYIVKECRNGKLVLECSYMGNDPYATFTDTYYLYQ